MPTAAACGSKAKPITPVPHRCMLWLCAHPSLFPVSCASSYGSHPQPSACPLSLLLCISIVFPLCHVQKRHPSSFPPLSFLWYVLAPFVCSPCFCTFVTNLFAVSDPVYPNVVRVLNPMSVTPSHSYVFPLCSHVFCAFLVFPVCRVQMLHSICCSPLSFLGHLWNKCCCRCQLTCLCPCFYV